MAQEEGCAQDNGTSLVTTSECGFNRVGHSGDVAYTIGATEAFASMLLAVRDEHVQISCHSNVLADVDGIFVLTMKMRAIAKAFAERAFQRAHPGLASVFIMSIVPRPRLVTVAGLAK